MVGHFQGPFDFLGRDHFEPDRRLKVGLNFTQRPGSDGEVVPVTTHAVPTVTLGDIRRHGAGSP